jgi:exosome complex component RRP46
MLGLLAASIPLGSMLTSTVLAVDADGVLLSDPTPKQLQQAASVHVFAFASGGNLLVAESEGDFNIDIWEMAEDKARGVCMGRQEGEDVGMEGQEEGGLERLVVDSVARKVATEQRWKEGIE